MKSFRKVRSRKRSNRVEDLDQKIQRLESYVAQLQKDNVLSKQQFKFSVVDNCGYQKSRNSIGVSKTKQEIGEKQIKRPDYLIRMVSRNKNLVTSQSQNILPQLQQQPLSLWEKNIQQPRAEFNSIASAAASKNISGENSFDEKIDYQKITIKTKKPEQQLEKKQRFSSLQVKGSPNSTQKNQSYPNSYNSPVRSPPKFSLNLKEKISLPQQYQNIFDTQQIPKKEVKNETYGSFKESLEFSFENDKKKPIFVPRIMLDKNPSSQVSFENTAQFKSSNLQSIDSAKVIEGPKILFNSARRAAPKAVISGSGAKLIRSKFISKFLNNGENSSKPISSVISSQMPSSINTPPILINSSQQSRNHFGSSNTVVQQPSPAIISTQKPVQTVFQQINYVNNINNFGPIIPDDLTIDKRSRSVNVPERPKPESSQATFRIKRPSKEIQLRKALSNMARTKQNEVFRNAIHLDLKNVV